MEDMHYIGATSSSYEDEDDDKTLGDESWTTQETNGTSPRRSGRKRKRPQAFAASHSPEWTMPDGDDVEQQNGDSVLKETITVDIAEVLHNKFMGELDDSTVKNMAAAIRNYKFTPESLVLSVMKTENGELVVIDGNSRLAAMRQLNKEFVQEGKPEPYDKINVIVHSENVEENDLSTLIITTKNPNSYIDKLRRVLAIMSCYGISPLLNRQVVYQRVKEAMPHELHSEKNIHLACRLKDVMELLAQCIGDKDMDVVASMNAYVAARKCNPDEADAALIKYMQQPGKAQKQATIKTWQRIAMSLASLMRRYGYSEADALMMEDELGPSQQVMKIIRSVIRPDRKSFGKNAAWIVDRVRKLMNTQSSELKETVDAVQPSRATATVVIADWKSMEQKGAMNAVRSSDTTATVVVADRKSMELKRSVDAVLPSDTTATVVIADWKSINHRILDTFLQKDRLVIVVVDHFQVGIFKGRPAVEVSLMCGDYEEAPGGSTWLRSTAAYAYVLVKIGGKVLMEREIVEWGDPLGLRREMTPQIAFNLFPGKMLYVAGCTPPLIAFAMSSLGMVDKVHYHEGLDTEKILKAKLMAAINQKQ